MYSRIIIKNSAWPQHSWTLKPESSKLCLDGSKFTLNDNKYTFKSTSTLTEFMRQLRCKNINIQGKINHFDFIYEHMGKPRALITASSRITRCYFDGNIVDKSEKHRDKYSCLDLC